VPFQALDVDSLVEALQALSNDLTADSKGASSRSEYLSRFTPAESASGLFRIYNDAGKNPRNS
jgi:hypothetical protein